MPGTCDLSGYTGVPSSRAVSRACIRVTDDARLMRSSVAESDKPQPIGRRTLTDAAKSL
jgi:hypothetical protein